MVSELTETCLALNTGLFKELYTPRNKTSETNIPKPLSIKAQADTQPQHLVSVPTILPNSLYALLQYLLKI